MADQEQDPNATPGGIPPKQAPFKPAEGAPSGGAPTLRRPILRRPGDATPAGAPAAAAPTGLPPAPGVKKDTSRIPLPNTAPAAPAMGGAAADIKTVKVKPLSAPQSGPMPAPEAPRPPSETQASKSKTSRISLEAALGAVAEAPAPAAGAPKTIRLKRPTDLPAGRITTAIPASAMPGATAHIGGMASTATAPIPNVTASVPVNQTARLPTSKLATQRLTAEDVVAGEGDAGGASMTRRKTIKVKRPAATALKVARPEGGEEAAEGGAPADEGIQALATTGGHRAVAGTGPDKAHWAFISAAVIAIIASIGLIWVLASQTFGPNSAVSGFARAVGPDLPSPIPGTVQ